jgi:hypothetical protein
MKKRKVTVAKLEEHDNSLREIGSIIFDEHIMYKYISCINKRRPGAAKCHNTGK